MTHARYEIVVAGALTPDHWARWFDEVVVSALPKGTTQFLGDLDQAALHGVLAKVRDLGLDLISVRRVDDLCGGA